MSRSLCGEGVGEEDDSRKLKVSARRGGGGGGAIEGVLQPGLVGVSIHGMGCLGQHAGVTSCLLAAGWM